MPSTQSAKQQAHLQLPAGMSAMQNMTAMLPPRQAPHCGMLRGSGMYPLGVPPMSANPYMHQMGVPLSATANNGHMYGTPFMNFSSGLPMTSQQQPFANATPKLLTDNDDDDMWLKDPWGEVEAAKKKLESEKRLRAIGAGLQRKPKSGVFSEALQKSSEELKKAPAKQAKRKGQGGKKAKNAKSTSARKVASAGKAKVKGKRKLETDTPPAAKSTLTKRTKPTTATKSKESAPAKVSKTVGVVTNAAVARPVQSAAINIVPSTAKDYNHTRAPAPAPAPNWQMLHQNPSWPTSQSQFYNMSKAIRTLSAMRY